MRGHVLLVDDDAAMRETLVAGLDEATSGTVSVAGVDLHRTPANRRDMGMVFQAYSLFPHLSVLDNVAFGLKMRGPKCKGAEEGKPPARPAGMQPLLGVLEGAGGATGVAPLLPA